MNCVGQENRARKEGKWNGFGVFVGDRRVDGGVFFEERGVMNEFEGKSVGLFKGLD